MTFASTKASRALIENTMAGENPKLFQEVIRLVESIPGGVSGLVQQLQERGLGHVASSLTGKGSTTPISPERIVQGLGTDKVNALAIESGLDVRIVRRQLVAILPKVVQQLAPAELAVEVAVPA